MGVSARSPHTMFAIEGRVRETLEGAVKQFGLKYSPVSEGLRMRSNDGFERYPREDMHALRCC